MTTAATHSGEQTPKLLGLEATYSSYLLHFPLQMGLMLWAAQSGWRIPRGEPAFFIAYLAVSLTLGVLAFRAFEMPMQRRLRRMA